MDTNLCDLAAIEDKSSDGRRCDFLVDPLNYEHLDLRMPEIRKVAQDAHCHDNGKVNEDSKNDCK